MYFLIRVGSIIHRMRKRKSSTNSAEHLQAIANSTSDTLIVIDHQGMVLSWNPAAVQMFGYSANEIIGKSLHPIIPERFHELHDQGLERVGSGGEQHVIGHAVELAGIRKPGVEFPIELTLSTWVSEQGRYFGAIIRDISDRQKMEDELRTVEKRSRSIMESANDAIITGDSKGDILSWNKAASTIFGYDSSEAIGKPLTIIIPEEYKSSHELGIERVSGGGEHHAIGKTVELSGLHKDGHLIPVELSLSTWLVGKERFFSGIIRNVSERKFIEEMHRAIELKFQSIAESANDAIISANEMGEIQSWNRAAENIFGYAADEMLGNQLTAIIPEKYRELHQKGIERVAGGGKHHVIGHSVELSGLHKDGREIPIELSLSTWTVKNKVFYSGIIRDITERKKSELKLLSQKKKLAKRAKSLEVLNNEVESKNEQLQALSNKLAKYLSRQVYTNIFEGKKDVKIESYRKKLTIFFSDIQGFTELTDRVESEVLTSALNKYLNEMSKIALDHGGTIDKYIGDAIMIFFGDPESLGEKADAVACIKMAIAMKKKLLEMRREWDVLGISKPLRVRMGINTGFCTVGNFGSDERLDYTIVGGAVNLASRLETAADVDEILVSEDTFSLIKDEIACKQHKPIKVKGIAYPIMTYAVLDLIETIQEEQEHIKAKLKGFNLTIDFHELDYTDKLYAREMLEKAISILETEKQE
jgi:PAS domain S-box-containing protein